MEYRYLLFIDINKFKDINDRYGHDEGDRVLNQFGEILISIFYKDKEKRIDKNFIQVPRIKNIVTRLGGDEFVVLVKINDERELNKLVTEDLHQKLLEKKIKVVNENILLSVSAGTVDLSNPRELKLYSQGMNKKEANPIWIADNVMYFAKGIAKILKYPNGVIAVHQWNDFDAIQLYSYLRSQPKKPKQKKTEIEKQKDAILNNFLNNHKRLFKYLKKK